MYAANQKIVSISTFHAQCLNNMKKIVYCEVTLKIGVFLLANRIGNDGCNFMDLQYLRGYTQMHLPFADLCTKK